jgi:hypothetical protein
MNAAQPLGVMSDPLGMFVPLVSLSPYCSCALCNLPLDSGISCVQRETLLLRSSHYKRGPHEICLRCEKSYGALRCSRIWIAFQSPPKGKNVQLFRDNGYSIPDHLRPCRNRWSCREALSAPSADKEQRLKMRDTSSHISIHTAMFLGAVLT